MTYQEFQQELQQKEKSPVYRSLETVREAIRKCPPKEQARLKNWSETLDKLTTASDSQFAPLREDLFSGLSEMIADYHAPAELFAEKKTQEAMTELFSALDLGRRKLPVPSFTEAGSEKAGKAMEEDLLDYSAQVVSFVRMDREAAPEEVFRAMGNISVWKKTRALRNMMEYGRSTAYDLGQGDTTNFLKEFNEEREEVRKNTRSFKEISDEIARKFREGQLDYSGLERQMKALRADTESAVSQETDPVKRSRLREQTKVYYPAYEEKTEQLEREERQRVQTGRSEAYQRKLAEEFAPVFEEQTRLIREVYGAKPVFHPEFAGNEASGYEKNNFEKSLPEVDTSRLLVGGKPVSNEEFASLATLAVYDPAISCHLSDDYGLIDIEPNEDASLQFHSHRVVNFANEYRNVNGRTLLGPDPRAGRFIAAEVRPAREKVKEALEAYQSGDMKPLAKIIAYGVRCGTDLSRHEVRGYNPGPLITSGDDSPVRYRLVDGHAAMDKMMQGAMELMKRDPWLEQAARNAGMTMEEQDKVMGFQKGQQIFKAGEAAIKKLLEAARGGDPLSDFEKEQCALAVQRRNVLVQSLREHEKTMTEDPRSKQSTKERENKLQEIRKKIATAGNRSREAFAEILMADAKWNRKYVDVAKTPPVYRRLGEKGAYALDEMMVESRLGKEKAVLLKVYDMSKEIEKDRERLRKLSAYELAGELGVTAPVKATAKTAREVYDDLTKDYKAGKMNYVLYEARLRAMRDLTGGRKQARIDLETIDAAVKYRLQKKEESRAPVEKAISKMTGPEAAFDGKLGFRLRGIFDMYGLTPKLFPTAVKEGGYTVESFSKLKDFQAKQGEAHLKLGKFAPTIGNDDFAVLAAAATQTYPEIGGVFVVNDSKTGIPVNVVENPTLEDAISLRTHYLTDACHDTNGARKMFDVFLENSVLPAREKVNDVLREYNGGNGPAEELGKILGMGLHNMVDTYLMERSDQDFIGDSTLEAAISGRLLDMIESAPDKLKKEACKYASPEDLEKARGLKIIYDLTRGAGSAMQRLEDSVNNGTPLPETERRACIELVLRQRAMVISAKNEAKIKDVPENYQKALDEFEKADKSTPAKNTLAYMKLNNAKNRNIGLPEYTRALGAEGPEWAKKLLDNVLPNREPFFALGDKEIVAALKAKIGSRDDPFQSKEFTKQVFQEDRELAKALREREIKAPQAGGKSL